MSWRDDASSEEHPSVRRDAEEMIRRGWVTKEEDWREFKKGIEDGNKDVVRRILLQSYL